MAYHFCHFCPAPKRPAEPDATWGNGEIWLTASDGTNYAAPVMIVHYIDEHRYLPPAAFIAAVRGGSPTALSGDE